MESSSVPMFLKQNPQIPPKYMKKTILLAAVALVASGVCLKAETPLTGDYQITGKLRAGSSATNTGNHAFALGANAAANNPGSYAIGYGAQTSGDHSYAFGNSAATSANYSVSIGSGASATALYSYAIGRTASATAQSAVALGYSTVGSGLYSLATGRETTSSGDYSATFGYKTVAPWYMSFVTGRYNSYPGTLPSQSWTPTEPLFVIGAGNSDIDRSNAMTVLKNGAVLINPTGDLSMGDFMDGTHP